MVKDGSAWGALSGVTAAFLAADGFTGAPAMLAEAPEVAEYWVDLGTRWRILEQYFKAYPVCRWAQPAVEAAIDLQRQFDLRPAAIVGITVASFEAAVRLVCRAPATTEEAQYQPAVPRRRRPCARDRRCGRGRSERLHGPGNSTPEQCHNSGAVHAL